ncbi:MAG: glycosyl transferase group 1 [Panacagrimonas sp.]|nr:glycosyltransferase family 4 protein [Panacagrimonas sp.]MCC2657961.1 glycosyl transferase group 1 [Panacagrimonas sp.]
MKIAYVVTRSDAVGGAQVHVRDLAGALRDSGHEPVVLCGGNGPWLEQLKSRHIEVVRLRHMERSISPLRDLRALFELRSWLRKLAPDLVSTHTAKAGWLGRIAAFSLGLPVMFTAHGWTFTDGVAENASRLWRVLERIAGRLADKIVTVSRFDRDLALRARIAAPDRVVAIHNGMPDVPSALRAQAGRQPPHLVMVARFEEQKDHRTLLRALSTLQHLPWRTSFVGGGPLEASMRELCAQLRLGNRVSFLGARSDVADILSDAQIFVLCTHWEGLPRSIIEAMRAGLPVVATRVAGVPELVEHGVSGLLCAAADQHAVAASLEQLLGSPSLREAMGVEARRRYLAGFRFEHMLARTMETYAEVLASRARPRPGIAAPDAGGAGK